MSNLIEDRLTKEIWFEFEGKGYTLKRLSILDVYKAGKLLKEIGPKVNSFFSLVQSTKTEGLEIFIALLELLPDDPNKIFELLNSIIQPTFPSAKFNIADASQFPLGAFGPFLEAMKTHPDITHFSEQLKKMATPKATQFKLS